MVLVRVSLRPEGLHVAHLQPVVSRVVHVLPEHLIASHAGRFPL
jgi:hypothetical protein